MNKLNIMKKSNSKSITRHLEENLRRVVAALLTSALITGCGGGSSGGSAGSNNSTVQDANAFSPDESRLETSADSSSGLFVEPGFTFDDMNDVLLSLYASGVQGEVLSNTKVTVYAIEKKFSDWQEIGEGDRQLLTIGRTDALGHFEGSLEVSPRFSQLLVVVAALGIENKRLVDIDSTVSINFAAG